MPYSRYPALSVAKGVAASDFDAPPPVHLSEVFPAPLRSPGDISPVRVAPEPMQGYAHNLARKSSPIRQRPWRPVPANGVVVYPPTETVERTSVAVVPTYPAEMDAKNDHLKDRLEVIEAQMEIMNMSKVAVVPPPDDALVLLRDRLAEAEAALYNQELENLRATILQKQSRIDELESKLLDRASQVLPDHDSDGVIAELRLKLSDERRQIDELRKQLEELRKRHKEMLSSALDDINAANEKLTRQELRIEELLSELASERARADQLQSALDNGEGNASRLLRDLARAEDLIRELEREKDELKKRLASLGTDGADADARTRRQLIELEEALRKAKAEIEDLLPYKKKCTLQEDRISDLEDELSRLKRELVSKDDEMRLLKNQLANEDRSDDLDRLKEKWRLELIRTEEEAAKRNKSLQDEIARLLSELERSESKRQILEDEKKHALHRADNAEEGLTRANRQLDRLKDIEKLYDESQLKNRELERKIRTLQDSLEDSDRATKREKDENERLQSEIDRLKAELDKSKDDVDNLRRELDKLRSTSRGEPRSEPSQTTVVNPPPVLLMNQDGEEEIMRMGAELRRALRVREEALAEVETLQKLLGKSKRQHEVTQQELETCEVKLLAMRRQVEDLKDELEAATSQLSRARVTAQEALEEADASSRLLHEARKAAEDARERMQAEALRTAKDAELAAQSWSEALQLAESEKRGLEERYRQEAENSVALKERLHSVEAQFDEASRQLVSLQDLLQRERGVSEEKHREHVRQLADSHNRQLQNSEDNLRLAIQQTKETEQAAHRETRSQRDALEREVIVLKDASDRKLIQDQEILRNHEDQLSQAFTEIKSSNQELQKTKDELMGMMAAREGTEQELISTQLALAKIQDHATTSSKEGDDLRRALRAEEDRYKATINAIESELSRYKAELEAMTRAERGQQEALTEIHRCYEEASVEAKQLRALLANTTSEADEVKESLKEANEKVVVLARHVEDVTQQRDGEAEKHHSAEALLVDLQKDMGLLAAKYDEKKLALDNTAALLQEQTAASGTASDQLAEVARRLQATSTELDLVKQEKTSLVEEIHHSTLQMHTIQEKVTSLSMEIDEGKLALSSEKAEVQRLKHLEVRLQTELDSTNERLSASWESESNMKQELCQMQTTLQVAVTDGKVLQEKLAGEGQIRATMIGDHEVGVQTLSETIARFKKEVEDMRSKLQESVQNEELSQHRLKDIQRHSEMREQSIIADLESERITRSSIEEQLAAQRKQFANAKREQSIQLGEADKEREALDIQHITKTKKIKQDYDELNHVNNILREKFEAIQLSVQSENQQKDSEIEQLRLTCETLRVQLSDAAHEISSVETSCATKNQQLLAATEMDRLSLSDLVSKCDILSQQNNELQQQELDARSKNECLLQDLHALEAKLTATEEELCRVQVREVEVGTSFDRLQVEHNGLVKEFSHLGQQHSATESEKLTTQVRESDTQKRYEALQLQYGNVEVERRALLQDMATFKAHIETLDAEKKSLVLRVSDLTAVEKKSDILQSFIESILTLSPIEELGRVMWRLNMDDPLSLSPLIVPATEVISNLFQLRETSSSLNADFDFICATREPLIREITTCRKSVFGAYKEASVLMEELLKTHIDVRSTRDLCGKLCAGLGGLKSQLMWITSHCMSTEERQGTGIELEPSASGGLVSQIRKYTTDALPPTTPTPTLGVTARHLIVSPGPADFASCVGSEDLGRGLSRSLPRTTPRKVSVVAPEDLISSKDMSPTFCN